MPVTPVAVAEPLVEVTVLLTVIVPLLTMLLDPPVATTPPVLEVMVPLFVMVAGAGPVDVTAVCEPPAMVPLLVRLPPAMV